MLSNKPYKGTRDFFPEDKRKLDYIFTKIKEVMSLYSYEAYDGPILEDTKLYRAKSGDEIVNDQMYHFTDKGERSVAIRPEMTPTLARMISQIVKEEPLPFRWFSFPNLMRFEKPQRGRLREHWQLNCDIYGAPMIWGEVEIFCILIDIMNALGANESQFNLLINDKKLVQSLFSNVLNFNDSNKDFAYKLLDKSKKITTDELNQKMSHLDLSENNLKIFKEYLSLDSFDSLFTFAEMYNLSEHVNDLKSVYKEIKALNLNQYLTYDPSIVRGLDYYTGIVFEVFDTNPQNPRAICGGGRYDNLLEIFNGPSVSGIGFGMGDVTLTDFLDVHGLLPSFTQKKIDVFVTPQVENIESRILEISRLLRAKGLSVESLLAKTKIKKVFSQANKKGAKFVILIGDNEIENNEITIKNLDSREQKSLKLEELSEFFD